MHGEEDDDLLNEPEDTEKDRSSKVASEVAERTSTRAASFLPPRGWSPELEERGAHKVTARAFV